MLTGEAPLVEQIITSHLISDAPGVEVAPGALVSVEVDFVYLQDGNSPTIARLFEENGFDAVFDPERIAFVFDHTVLVADSAMANRMREAEAFGRRLGARIVPRGRGISHLVAIEEGWFHPGTLVVGSDSHTCTGGAVQSLALGMGASDVAATMLTGRTWLRVPDTVWLRVHGTPHPSCRTKDVLLHVLGSFGQTPFLYRSVQWCGPWVQSLNPARAASVASMGVEMGAKCVFLSGGSGAEGSVEFEAPAGDARVLDVDIDGLGPMVARPHSPEDVVPLRELAGESIDYVFLGSCTNSRLEDIGEAAAALRGRMIPDDVHFVVTPGSRQVYQEALRHGFIETLTSAGALVTPPGCGACVGTQGTVPASGQRVLSTMNRNFRGRMGNPDADIFLSSPLVAAHTARLGRLPDLEELTADA